MARKYNKLSIQLLLQLFCLRILRRVLALKMIRMKTTYEFRLLTIFKPKK